jgi:hypothetical protein
MTSDQWYSVSMDETPDFLTPVKTVEIGLNMYETYAADRDGNVWRSTIMGHSYGEWKLYKPASDIQFTTPSFDQVVQMNTKQGD